MKEIKCSGSCNSSEPQGGDVYEYMGRGTYYLVSFIRGEKRLIAMSDGNIWSNFSTFGNGGEGVFTKVDVGFMVNPR